MTIYVAYVSACGKYIAIMEDRCFSEWITASRPGRPPKYNDLYDPNKWIELGEL